MDPLLNHHRPFALTLHLLQRKPTRKWEAGTVVFHSDLPLAVFGSQARAGSPGLLARCGPVPGRFVVAYPTRPVGTQSERIFRFPAGIVRPCRQEKPPCAGNLHRETSSAA